MDRATDFLRELVAQQERNPDHDPSGQTIADALQLDRNQAEAQLSELLEDQRVEILPTTARMGDGPLDELLTITTAGRIEVERADSGETPAEMADPSMRFLRSVAKHLDGKRQTRVSATAIATPLRLDHEEAGTTIDDLAALGLIKVHNLTRPRMGGRALTDLLELTTEGRAALSEARTTLVGSAPGEPLGDVWTTRDLPVLTEAARVLDSEAGRYGLRVQDLIDATSLSLNQVELALRALEADALLEVRWAHPRHASRVSGLSSAARRHVQLWPTAETALDRMIAALEAIADNTDEADDTRSRARKILEGVGGAGRQVGISVMAAAITGQIPGV